MLTRVIHPYDANECKTWSIEEHVNEYVEDRGLGNIYGCSTKNVYDDYTEFCKGKGYGVTSHTRLSRTLCRDYPVTIIVTKVNGKSVRVMMPKATPVTEH